MSSMIWLLVAILLKDAVKLFAEDGLPKSEILFARPELVEAFKSLLIRALDSGGAYHRDLLISADIIPAPPGYESLKDDAPGEPQEIPLSPEMYEYFNKHIKDVLTSIEKIDHAMSRLFGKRMSQSPLVDPKDSLHPKLAERLKSFESKVEPEKDTFLDISKGVHSSSEQASLKIDCNAEENRGNVDFKDSLSEIPELPSLPEVDFVMTPKSERASENEFATSSIVDKITSEYKKVFSETPDSSSRGEPKRSKRDLTPFDDEFIMHVLSGADSPSGDDFSTTTDESIKQTEFLSTTQETATDLEGTETIFDPVNLSPIHGRVLTIEEVQLLDQSSSLEEDLKYQVISTYRSDYVHFFTTDEISSSKETGKKRRRINPRGLSPEEPIFYQAPTPHRMLLRYYRDIPDTSFTCENKSLPGFYADLETDCQVFHVCWPGRRESFLCPVGSLFNQRVLSCDKFNNTNCSLSHAYFDVNTAFQEYDDAVARNVTPRPDPMMRPIQNDSGTTEIIVKKSNIVELFEADLHFSEMINKTVITELWEYMPVKVKVFVYPEPADLKKFLEEHHHHHPPHKVRKSKDVRGIESSTETDTDEDMASLPDDILEKRNRIEANIIRVLKKLSRKHRD